MPKTISLVMIVKNSGEKLKRAVDSCIDLCSEIIIVDTGSEDATPVIASQLGAEVYYYTWKNDFAAARNFALQHAACEWVLILDDDEELNSDSLKNNIDLLEDPQTGGICLNIKNKLEGNDAFSKHKYTRLFRNMPEFKYSGRIHEQIRPSIEDAGFNIIDSEIEIIHYGYMKNDPSRNSRNKDLLMQELADNPNDDFSKYHLALTAFSSGEFGKVIEVYNELKDSEELSTDQKDTLRLKTAQVYLKRGDYHNTLDISEKKCLNSDAEGLRLYIRAALFMQQQEYEKAFNIFSSKEIQHSNLVDKAIITEALNMLKKILI